MMRLEDDPDYQAAMADRRAESMGYNHSKENSRHLTGKWLAELLGVSPAAVSKAASKEHRCQGYPVYKWKDDDGRYWVPMSVYKDLTKDLEVENGRPAERSNPSSTEASSETDAESSGESESAAKSDSKELREEQDDDSPSKEKPESSSDSEEQEKPEKQKAEGSDDSKEQEQPEKVEKALEDGFINNSGNISLLPESQNYVEPVIAGSIGSVGTSLVETDTPNGRAVMYSTTVGVFSYMWYKFTDDHWAGALIGALIGFGSAYLGNMSYNYRNMAEDDQQDLSDIKPNTDLAPDPESKSWDHAIDWPQVAENLRSIGNGKSAENEQLESVDLPANKAS